MGNTNGGSPVLRALAVSAATVGLLIGGLASTASAATVYKVTKGDDSGRLWDDGAITACDYEDDRNDAYLKIAYEGLGGTGRLTDTESLDGCARGSVNAKKVKWIQMCEDRNNALDLCGDKRNIPVGD
ncbi:hypothetical protein [Streptomyces sp. NPDC050704]|uniref:hypothetical protein n=1 Tax=Streptomyces sp. NPDC050704 TaxID=3157219 RepID=UPI00342A94B2